MPLQDLPGPDAHGLVDHRAIERSDAIAARKHGLRPSVEPYLTEIDGRKLVGPNDLVFNGEGEIFFTDMGDSDLASILTARLPTRGRTPFSHAE